MLHIICVFPVFQQQLSFQRNKNHVLIVAPLVRFIERERTVIITPALFFTWRALLHMFSLPKFNAGPVRRVYMHTVDKFTILSTVCFFSLISASHKIINDKRQKNHRVATNDNPTPLSFVKVFLCNAEQQIGGDTSYHYMLQLL